MGKERQKKLVNAIKALCKERGISLSHVVLFGSSVKGTAVKDSDVDIIVLSKDFEGKGIFERVALTRGIHRELVNRFMIPVDLMYYSLSEWRKGTSLILETAKKEGIRYS